MIRTWRCASVLLLAGASLSAQQPAGSPPAQGASPSPTFTLAVDYVEVDAIVTDGTGSAVRGLAKDDFQLFEDGKRQTITTFSVVDLPMPPASTSATSSPPNPIAPPASDVASNARPFDGRLYVMVIDDLHLPMERVARLRAIAREFVQQDLGPGDRMAVVHALGPQTGNQEFTSDKQRLLAAIDSTTSYTLQASGDANAYDVDAKRAEDARAALDSLRAVSDWFSRVRNLRKAILFVSEGIDYNILNVVPDLRAAAEMNINPGVNVSPQQFGGAVIDATRDAVNAALRNDVAIYSIDPVGVDSAAGLAQDSLRTLSDETGGFAVVNQNDFSAPYRRIVADNSAYYVLAYTPPSEKRDGKFHKIEMKVDRPGVTVRARRGYVAPKSDAKKVSVRDSESAEIREALNNPIPVTGLMMEVFAAPFKGTAANASVLVGAELRGRDLQLTGSDTIQLAYEAIDAAGKTLDAQTRTVTLSPNPDTKALIERTGVRLLNRMNLPPGRYQLRVAARDASGRVGSAFSDLLVTDFSEGPLALSGIVLASTSSSTMPTAQPDEALRAVLPATPGALRAFPQSDTLALYAEAYDHEDGAPQQIELTATITDSAGKVLFKKAESREVQAAASKAGFAVQAPMKDLPPGSYILTVAARSGTAGVAPATRQLPFTVVASHAVVPTGEAMPAAGVPCCRNTSAYETAVRAFAHGDRAAASIAVARASSNDLEQVVSSLNDHDPPVLEAASAMHLALASRAADAGNRAEWSVQLRIGEKVFQKIRRPPEHPAFIGTWYLAATEMCLGAGDFDAAAGLVGQTLRERSAPAALLLVAGIVDETKANVEGLAAGLSAREPGGVPRRAPLPGEPSRDSRVLERPVERHTSERTQRAVDLADAERKYRQSLQNDPALEEARLRLGRVLTLQGKDTEARTELETVLNLSHDSRVAYLAHLFLADLAARRQDTDAEADQYLAAIAADSSARVAYIGLSNLALLAGDDRRARDYVRQWSTASAVDPWTLYRAGLDQLEGALQALLGMISR